ADSEREFTIAANEILTHVVVPISRARNATYEIRQRHGLDWPEASASVAVMIVDGKVASASACLGHVAPTPWVVDVSGLVGKELTAETTATAAAKAVAGATPLAHNGHKVELAKVALTRALKRAAGMEVVR
ncbi:MAG: molybdopterin dehydrogenase, partial [Planctomycetes bacterium]|nr:molybdopterin dehydrogenase [Planctomycetota bacterium]